MSKDRLKEAITTIEEMLRNSDKIARVVLDTDRLNALAMLAAAARAYACERCKGTGKTRDEFDGICHLCPDCAEWRRIADGGEG